MKINKKPLRYTLLGVVLVVFGGLTMAATSPDFNLGRNIQILFNMFRELSLIYVDPIDSDKLLKDAAEGMVSNLDPYTELIPESEMADFEMMTTGKYGGMGALIRKSGDYVIIAQPYQGFPADKAGLIIGDMILAIDDEDIKGFDVSEVSNRLKGTPGTSFQLKVRRLMTGKEEIISIRRERIVISGITYYGVVSDSIGYIALSDFTEDCSSDFKKAFNELKSDGITSLILDLRNNGGGILQEAVKIMSMFVPKNTEVVSMQGRLPESQASFTTAHDPLDTQIPVTVLVNRSSASAAEIVAGAFQDLDRGVLIGQRTFGKGLVQGTRPLGYNAFLKVTTAKYYIPSGRCIQAIDYSHRAEDGSVDYVPDSLIREFNTANGRKVYDGGGVMPDIVTTPEYLSRFAFALYADGYIEDFANEYYKTHRDGIDLKTFRLTDQDYENFSRFMSDKTVDFESETVEILKQLRTKAEREKYLERIETELAAIQDKIQEDKAADLISFRDDIVGLLEDEIVMRYHYKEGALQHGLENDADVVEAIRLLNNTGQYRQILSSQDTRKK